MRIPRWLDHLPPWLAFGGLAGTGLYTGAELGIMTLPLLAAAVVEARRRDLGPWRRILEIFALLVFLLQIWMRVNLVLLTVNLLFLLCGIRLALPREPPQRRQILLMGFLLFLTTTLADFGVEFIGWALAWVGATGILLMQLNWERSAAHRPGPLSRPPYGRMAKWSLAVVLVASGFFVVLPRLRLGFRAFPVGMQGLGSQAGLSDALDLGGGGPIAASGEVAFRVAPREPLGEAARIRCGQALELMRGLVLERVEGQRWETDRNTLARRGVSLDGTASARGLDLDLFLGPSPLGVVPLPYGRTALDPPQGMPLRLGDGASLRLLYPTPRMIPIHLRCQDEALDREPVPEGRRLARLLETGLGTESALRWSLQAAPGRLPPPVLAGRLAAALRRFRYTSDNPSGRAENPLEDFLERSRAGHCEYFASSLALMLRHRGVPARVANGYRLGPWIGEGSYWLVTQNEAHSWVEYYDPTAGGWRAVDPTPASPAPPLGGQGTWATLMRWSDSLSFRWDRYVVRFSDEDQLAGLDWLQAKAIALPRWRPDRRQVTAAVLAAILLVLFRFRRLPLPWTPRRGPQGIPQLRPLLRRTRREAPVREGETARVWLLRLADLRPDRAEALSALARETDAVAYGGREAIRLATLAREESDAWDRKKVPH
jgi:protein-glutamine gamma-glutamyltransferase